MKPMTWLMVLASGALFGFGLALNPGPDLDRFAGIGKARLDDGEVVHPPDAFRIRNRRPSRGRVARRNGILI